MDNSKQRKLGAFFSYLSILVNTIIQLLYTPLLLRTLGQSEYGLYSLINSIIGYLAVLDLGFGNAIIVYTVKYRTKKMYDEERKLHGMFAIVFYVISCIATIIGLILYANVNNLFGKTMTDVELKKIKIMMLILTFNLAITFSFSIYTSIISAYEKFVYQKIISLVSTILKPIIMIPLLFSGYKSITMCIVITLVNVIVLLSNYYYCRKKLNIKIKFMGFDKKLFKVIFGYSFFVFLAMIVDKANWSIDQFILGTICGTIEVSIYSVASQLNMLFTSLSTAISGVFLPKMSEMVTNNAKPEELTNEFIKVGRIQYLIIFLMASGLILFGKNFINIWAGAGYEKSYYVALLLIIPVCFPLIQNLGISIIQAMNKFKFRAIITAIMAVFNVGISLILTKKYNSIGAALGTAISLIICNILIMNIYYYKVIKINVIKFWKEIIKMTIPFIIPIIVILFVMNITNIYGIVGFIIYGLTYTILYLIVSYIFSMNNYEKNLINKITKKIIGVR